MSEIPQLTAALWQRLQQLAHNPDSVGDALLANPEDDPLVATVNELQSQLHNRAPAPASDSELVHQTLQQTIDAVVIIDHENRVTFYNKAAERLWGYTSQEVLGRNVSMLVPHELQAHHDDYVGRNRCTGHDVIVGTFREVELERKDGSRCWVSLSLSRTETDGKIGYTAFLHDLSTIRQSEERNMRLLQRLNLSLEAAGLKLAEIDWEQQVLCYDGDYARLQSLPASENLPLPEFLEWIHPDDQLRLQEIWERAVSSEEKTFTVYYRIRTDERWEWREVLGRAIEEDGSPRLLGLIRDVTAQKRLEEELQRSERLSRRVRELTKSGVWSWDIRTDASYWSPECFEIMGLEVGQEVTSETFLSCIHPDDRDEVARGLESLFDGVNFLSREFRIVRHGEIRWIRDDAALRRSPEGEPLELFGALSDITLQRATATQRENLLVELQRSDNFSRRMRKLTRSGLWSFNLQTHEVWWSEELYEIHGYEPTAQLSSAYRSTESVFEEDRPLIREAFQRLIAERVPMKVEHRIHHASGELRWVSSEGEAVFDAAGNPTEVLGVVTDVSARKKAEEESLHVARLVSLGEASASLAHELKSPLAAMDLKAQMLALALRQQKVMDEKLHEKIGDVRKICAQLRLRLQHMQNFSRRESEDVQQCSLAELLENVWLLIGHTFDKYGMSRKLELSDDLPPVVGIPTHLEQVLINILNNARDAMIDRETRVLTLRGSREDKRIRIDVQDTGVGMSPEVRQRVFEEFFTTKGRDQGTGLGMGIVQRILHENHGEIAIESEVGVGTTTTVWLPIVAPEAPE
jgi:PAS domain S-box-containing protein